MNTNNKPTNCACIYNCQACTANCKEQIPLYTAYPSNYENQKPLHTTASQAYNDKITHFHISNKDKFLDYVISVFPELDFDVFLDIEDYIEPAFCDYATFYIKEHNLNFTDQDKLEDAMYKDSCLIDALVYAYENDYLPEMDLDDFCDMLGLTVDEIYGDIEIEDEFEDEDYDWDEYDDEMDELYGEEDYDEPYDDNYVFCIESNIDPNIKEVYTDSDERYYEVVNYLISQSDRGYFNGSKICSANSINIMDLGNWQYIKVYMVSKEAISNKTYDKTLKEYR